MKKHIITLALVIITAATFAQAPAERGINNINNSMPNRISMNVTTAKQTQGSNFGEKVAQGLQSGASALASGASLNAAPGNPATPAVTAADEHRTYTGGRRNEESATNQNISIIRSDKSISEKGIKRTPDAAVTSPGQPIGGIVVKGGISQ
ncbi:hypothetical protein [Mucilaginibacter pedocola]|uniref:Uncharacterized protein n=1 Tax=Mucilaginibacter pedocola TaxID=1792845 RepID=A0A1S9PCQ5_9SPHI|nr:hypothetical protein [Mucilaginibacter pedocola]OOQ58719.1 hypothetical protein BC343_08640 [Mucilaginibacter pedocola]